MSSKECIVLYDGKCNACNVAVYFTLPRNKTKRNLRYASLQSNYAKKLLRKHRIDVFVDKKNPDIPNQAVAIYQGKAATKSEASGIVLQQLDGLWPYLGNVVLAIPVGIRNYLYDLFASNRYRLFGSTAHVAALPDGSETLFLDRDEGIHSCPLPRKKK